MATECESESEPRFDPVPGDSDSEDDEFVEATDGTEQQAVAAVQDNAQSNHADESTNTVSKYGGRFRLPSRAANKDISILLLLKHCIGKDLSRITMPVIVNEPLGFLQRLAEHVQYYQLLLDAVQEKDKMKRLELVTAFAVSNCASNGLRLNKPFNPLLGETYELKRKALGPVHYVSEQVSHHPPISAYMMEVPGKFRFAGSIEPEVHFRGKHVDVTPSGFMTLEFYEHGDVYTWESPRMVVNNLIFGKMWLEIYGDMEVKNHTKNIRAVISFRRSGWFGKHTRRVDGYMYDESNKPARALYGDWAEGLFSLPLDTWKAYQATLSESSSSWYSLIKQYTTSTILSSNDESEKTDAPSGLLCDLQLKDQFLIWKSEKVPDENVDYFMFSSLAMTLNELTDEDIQLNLPPTDSRYRRDVQHLERAEVDAAAKEKHRMEEKQRAARRRLKELNKDWTPLWFELKPHPHLSRKYWTFNEKYYQRDWTQSPDIF